MNNIRTTLALSIAIAITGCHGTPKVTTPVKPAIPPKVTTPVKPGIPAITTLNMTIKKDTLTANATCSECELSQINYSWYLDNNYISNSSSYTLSHDDISKEILLKVFAKTSAVISKTAFIKAYTNDIISSTSRAFAALKDNNSVKIWGYNNYGGSNNTNVSLDNVKSLYSSNSAFAALKNDGTVAVWGYKWCGGENNNNASFENVKTIYSNDSAFAALRIDGTVEVWGNANKGGKNNTSASLSNIKHIYSNDYAFAALTNDGTVEVWGD